MSHKIKRALPLGGQALSVMKELFLIPSWGVNGILPLSREHFNAAGGISTAVVTIFVTRW